MIRNRSLDCLKGLAALIVMFHHYTENYGVLYGHKAEYPFVLMGGGRFGVYIFFLLTGYFILMSINKEKTLFDYWKKKLLNLYPIYFICVLTTFSFVYLFGLEGREGTVKDLVFNLFFLQELSKAKNIDGAYWTLLVQIRYYIIFGVLYFFIYKINENNKKISFRLLPVLWLACITFCQIIIPDSYSIQWILLADFGHVFLVGQSYYYVEKGENKKYFFAVIILCNVYSFISNGLSETILLLLAEAVTILFYTKKLNLKWLGAIGGYSYAIYLLHQNIGYILIRILEENGFTNEIFVLVPMAAIILLAFFITKFLEGKAVLVLKRIIKQGENFCHIFR